MSNEQTYTHHRTTNRFKVKIKVAGSIKTPTNTHLGTLTHDMHAPTVVVTISYVTKRQCTQHNNRQQILVRQATPPPPPTSPRPPHVEPPSQSHQRPRVSLPDDGHELWVVLDRVLNILICQRDEPRES